MLFQRFLISVNVLFFCASAMTEDAHWEKKILTTDFVSEGACLADIDGDGSIDLVSGQVGGRGLLFPTDFDIERVSDLSQRVTAITSLASASM